MPAALPPVLQAAVQNSAPPSTGLEAGKVNLPLSIFRQMQQRLRDLQQAGARQEGPAVVLGAADYDGQAVSGALSLTLRLEVTLGRPDQWKTVPLVGEDVVLVRAVLDEQPLAVAVKDGYHVWLTKRTGQFSLKVDLLVPARGPRGSIEYDFIVDRTPVTHFACRFPQPDLQPRLDAAVQSDTHTEGTMTVLNASLRPTARIHLVGFRDMGEAHDQPAKVYAEALHLLSLDEGSLELFSVMRYTILYAGNKEFRIALPADLTVVSADGEGAFRYTLEPQGNTVLLKGETAFPIRNNYEISLHLRRNLAKQGETFEVPLPRCQEVERESGWLAVEVPGKLRLVEEQRGQALAVDVRQLPAEMVRNAVSPILQAYRFHNPQLGLRLRANRLPEKEPASGSIDRVRAFTVVAPEGRMLSEMRITLRNRLRHSLAVQLPAGAVVRSTLIDGRPVKASRDEAGRLILPLKRSTGQQQLDPFTLQVVYEQESEALPWQGSLDLTLPATDLPVSALGWSLFLPASNLYFDLQGAIEPQTYAGRATWHQPQFGAPDHAANAAVAPETQGVILADTSAETGAMPVRINLPKTGSRMEYSQYWIAPDHPVQISVRFVRGWLRIPAGLLAAAVCFVGLVLWVGWARPRKRLHWKVVGIALLLAGLWPVYRLVGLFWLLVALALGGGLIGLRRGLIRRWPAALLVWLQNVLERLRSFKPMGALEHPWRLTYRLILVIVMLSVGAGLAYTCLQLLVTGLVLI